MRAVLDSKDITNMARQDDIAVIKKYLDSQGLSAKKSFPQYLKLFDSILGTIRGSGFGHRPGPFEAIGSIFNGEIRDYAFAALPKIIDGQGVKLHLFIDETDQGSGQHVYRYQAKGKSPMPGDHQIANDGADTSGSANHHGQKQGVRHFALRFAALRPWCQPIA